MFKKGDKVKIIGGYFKGKIGEVAKRVRTDEIYSVIIDDMPIHLNVENLELVSTHDITSERLKAKAYLNSLYGSSIYYDTDYKPSQDDLNYLESDVDMTYTVYKQLKEYDLLKPNHYQTKNGDLFDEWYERYPFDVFRIVLLATAERYFRRYHLKDGLDGLNKGIEVMKRLEEYELKEKNND